MDNSEDVTMVEWCAGYGGIHLGLKRAIPNLRVIAYGEIEAFACANLVAKMEAGLMDAAPIWSDIKTFPCEEFRDRVDILVAGYPCQPFSAAGKRQGADDPRHLWPHIRRAVGIIRPRICFFENVEGHISLGLSTVISDLEEDGYRTTWGIFSASEVGAPHQRKRVFILAVSNSLGGAAGLSRSLAWNEGITGVADHGGGKGGGVAESSPQYAQGCINGMLRREDREDGLPWEHRGSSIFCGTAWPSRPGEQQFAWEPPRVVGAVPAKLADFCTRDAQSGGDSASTGGEGSGERGEGEDSMPHSGSSVCGGDQGDKQAMVNAMLAGSSPERASRGQQDGLGEPSDGAMGNSNSPRPQERTRQRGSAIQGADADGGADANGAIEQPMGDPAYGTPDGLGVAELSGLSSQELAEIRHWMVASDNRTDELRLLGNGVVPATAERAWRVLTKEITT